MLKLNLASLKRCSKQPEAQRLFRVLEETIQELHREVRAVSNSTEAPPLRDDLPAVLGVMAKRFSEIANVNVSMGMRGDYVAQSDEVEASLYRIAQEALANVGRHAGATKVNLQLDYRKGTLTLTIEDDGVGFTRSRGVNPREIGNGVDNIRRRVREMGGRLAIRQLSPGSRIAVTIGQSALPGVAIT